MQPQHASVTISGQRLHAPRHVCCFFDSREQQYAVLAPYLKEGLAQREKAMVVVCAHHIDDHHQRLNQAGIPVEQALANGTLSTYSSETTYLTGGVFDKQRMLAMLANELTATAAGGYARLRTCGDMNWMLEHVDSTEVILEYESEVNELLESNDATFMCVYDVNAISGGLMRDVLNTHPQVLMGSVLYENPYYLTPSDYRKTLAARRSASNRLLTD